MSQASARLVVRFGALSNQEYLLDGRLITMIGREPINDIALNEPEISRRHARIDFDGSHYTLEDLGSTNGTYLNGRRLTEPTPLKNGDVIEFGESISFTFQMGDDADRTMAEAHDQLPEYAATAMQWSTPFSDDIPLTHPLQQTGGDPPLIMPPAQSGRRFSTTSALAGCGCLFLLLGLLCLGSLYALDSLNPDLLYCNWLSFIFENTTTCQ
jgi:hypothetical protein